MKMSSGWRGQAGAGEQGNQSRGGAPTFRPTAEMGTTEVCGVEARNGSQRGRWWLQLEHGALSIVRDQHNSLEGREFHGEGTAHAKAWGLHKVPRAQRNAAGLEPRKRVGGA